MGGYGYAVTDGKAGATECPVAGKRLRTKLEIGHRGRAGRGNLPVAE